MLLDYWYFENRDNARLVEQEVLQVVRNRGPGRDFSNEDMPQDGYTEAFSSDQISSKKVVKIINATVKQHSDSKLN